MELTVEKSTNDFFDHWLYRINKMYMHHIGIWPYQRLRFRILIPALFVITLITIVVPEVIKLIDVWGKINKVFECIPPYLVIITSMVKMFNGALNVKKMEAILARIHNDWKTIRDDKERGILLSYAVKGRKLTIYYSVYIYWSMTLYLTMPLTPQFLDFVSPLNGSRPHKYLFEADYRVADPDKYYYLILLHAYVTTILTIMIIVVVDSTYMMYAQHACGLFAVSGYKFRQMVAVYSVDNGGIKSGSKKRLDTNLDILESRALEHYKSSIKTHQSALGFAQMLESSFTVSLLLQVALNLIVISITGVQTILNLNDKDNVVRFGSFTIAQMMHLFFNSIPGQLVIDHSSHVFDDVYNTEWYLTSTRVKKLLCTVLGRSYQPSMLTAGKLYAMSMINFSSVIQTSLSYFTVFSSMQ